MHSLVWTLKVFLRPSVFNTILESNHIFQTGHCRSTRMQLLSRWQASVARTNDIKIDRMWFTCKWYYCKISTGQADTVSSPRSASNANMRLEEMREIHSLSLSLTQHLFFQLGEQECIHEVPSNRLQLFCSFKGHVIRLQICAEPPTLFLRLLSHSFDCLVRTRIQFHPPLPPHAYFPIVLLGTNIHITNDYSLFLLYFSLLK